MKKQRTLDDLVGAGTSPISTFLSSKNGKDKQERYDQYYLKMAIDFGNRFSKDARLKVGALLCRDNRIIANAYNDVPSCWPEFSDTNDTETVLHAEMNLVAFCAQHGISMKDTTLYVSHQPCTRCCAFLASVKVARVLYCFPFEGKSSINKLHGIQVKQLLIEDNAQ